MEQTKKNAVMKSLARLRSYVEIVLGYGYFVVLLDLALKP